MSLFSEIASCRQCADRFAQTHSAHVPRPVVWFQRGAKLLLAGQAPGMRVHTSGKPFDDPSGDRLRDWLGLTPEEFYDRQAVAILPMAFCFPGYNANGSDLPPPPDCAKTWRKSAMELIGDVPLTVLIGGYAQKWHLNTTNVTQTVRDWAEHAPNVFPVPHPSWRNTGWIRKNPWFETDLLPELRARVKAVLK